jgi:hypothetical protein
MNAVSCLESAPSIAPRRGIDGVKCAGNCQLFTSTDNAPSRVDADSLFLARLSRAGAWEFLSGLLSRRSPA